MALKLKIKKSEFEALDDVLKKEYISDGSEYKLDVPDMEDLGPLRRAKDHEVEKRKAVEQELKKVQKKVEDLEGDSEKVTELQNSIAEMKTKHETAIAEKDKEFETEKSTMRNTIKSDRIKNTAMAMAQQISTKPNIMSRFIQDRIDVTFDEDGKPSTVILDSDGDPSKMTLDDLKKEMVANDDFKDMIVASKAKGGAEPKPKGGARDNPTNDKPADLASMKPNEFAAWLKETKAERDQAEETED